MTLKNGEVFSGIFFGASVENNESTYMLKMVQQIKTIEKSEINGAQDDMGALVGVGDDHTALFDIQDVTDLAVEGVGLGSQDKHQNGNISLQCRKHSHYTNISKVLQRGFAQIPTFLATLLFVNDNCNPGLLPRIPMLISLLRVRSREGHGTNSKRTSSFLA